MIADYISGDPEKIRKEAGVVSGVLESPVKPEERTKPFECLICLEDYVMDETYALGCGHRYCKTCWQQYLELKVTTEANSVNTKCPFPTCKEVVHEQAFHKLMGAEKAIQLYDQFALRSLVEDNLFVLSPSLVSVPPVSLPLPLPLFFLILIHSSSSVPPRTARTS